MILFPAIDLKDGACVRLVRGAMDEATIYNPDPLDQARKFAQTGFEWLHIVDLNGAVEGKPINAEAVRRIVEARLLKIQLGGGIRDLEQIATWLDLGVDRVILGTLAVKQPEIVEAACQRYPGRIAVSIDARGGLVATDGWTQNSTVKAMDLAVRMEKLGVAAIIYTDIDRDGVGTGVNIDATVDLAYALKIPVIASGGLSSLEDLRDLAREADAGILGVISGRALYDGRIDPAAALRLLTLEGEGEGEGAGPPTD